MPLPKTFKFCLSPPAVVCDLWEPFADGPGEAFTTVGNWRQPGEVHYRGEVYTWSKHQEFLKFLDLPARTGQSFELGLSSYEESDRRLLESHGWRVRHALDFSKDVDQYRDYVVQSRGEFTVAKDQNVRLRSGWFSERSAQYLAAGRPVIMQDTGFGNYLPVGEGLFGFSTIDQAVSAVQSVNADYERHRAGPAAGSRVFRFRHRPAKNAGGRWDVMVLWGTSLTCPKGDIGKE